MEFTEEYGCRIDAAVCAALTDCNGGKPFASWQEWLRVGRRIGIRRIEFHDNEIVPAPILRFDPGGTQSAVLYLPRPKSRHQLYRWLLHEFGEIIMLRELAPPFYYPAEWGDHHDMAVIVEDHHQEPIAFLDSLPDF